LCGSPSAGQEELGDFNVAQFLSCFAFSRQGQTVVTGRTDGLVRLWEKDSGVSLGQPMRHEKEVDRVALSPDGKLLLTASNGEAHLWQLPAGKLLKGSIHHGAQRIEDITFGSDGRTFLTQGPGEGGREACLWDSTSYNLVGEPFKREHCSVFADYGPEGKTLVTCGWSDEKKTGAIQVWDVLTGRTKGPPFEIDPSFGTPLKGSSSPDGRTVTVYCQNYVFFCRIDPTRPTMEAPVLFLRWHYVPGDRLSRPDFAYSPDGRHLVTTCGYDGTAQVWEVDTGLPLGESIEHPEAIDRAWFDSSGHWLLTRNRSTLWRWELQLGRPDEVKIVPEFPSWDGLLSADNRYALAVEPSKPSRLIQTSTGKVVAEVSPSTRQIKKGFTFSPDGRLLVVVTEMGIPQIWDTATGKPVRNTEQLAKVRDVHCVAFSPDSKLFATGTGKAQVWDAATREEVGVFSSIPSEVTALAFDASGKKLAVGYQDGKVQVWDLVARQPVSPLINNKHEITDILLSPDGEAVLVVVPDGFDQRLHICEVPTGRPIRVVQEPVGSVAFSPDGQTALVGSSKRLENWGEARLWSVSSWEPFGLPFRHQDPVKSTAFAPDGRLALTATRDGTLRFWGAKLSRPVGPPLTHPGLLTLGFQADSRAVVAVSGSNVRTWHVPVPVRASHGHLKLWVETITGLQLDAGGGTSWLTKDEWEERHRQLLERGAEVSDEPTLAAPIEERRPRLGRLAIAPAAG
jgi:WD40 repeat protein